MYECVSFVSLNKVCPTFLLTYWAYVKFDSFFLEVIHHPFLCSHHHYNGVEKEMLHNSSSVL